MLKQRLKEKLEIDEKLSLTDELSEIRKQITELKNKKTDYLLQNSEYIFEYFEKKKNISKGNSKSVKVMNAFFNKKTIEKKKESRN